MLDLEKFPRDLKRICDSAWKVDGNSTINSMVEWIIKNLNEELFFPYFKELEDRIKELEDGNEDGRIQKPKRHQKAGT